MKPARTGQRHIPVRRPWPRPDPGPSFISLTQRRVAPRVPCFSCSSPRLLGPCLVSAQVSSVDGDQERQGDTQAEESQATCVDPLNNRRSEIEEARQKLFLGFISVSTFDLRTLLPPCLPRSLLIFPIMLREHLRRKKNASPSFFRSGFLAEGVGHTRTPKQVVSAKRDERPRTSARAKEIPLTP